MRYEVVIKTSGMERVVKDGIRREPGAANERDIAVRSEYANKRKRGGRTVQGAVADDPNAVAVVWYDEIATIVTIITYRAVSRGGTNA